MDYTKYTLLACQYLTGEIESVRFSEQFDSLYLGDQTAHTEEVFDVLETLFYFSDSFEPSKKTRDSLHIQVDEKDLLWATRDGFLRLKNLCRDESKQQK